MKGRFFAFLVGCLTCLGGVQAAQHALVVGISDYMDADADTLENLDGADNDAVLVASTLRSLNVSLPDERILLNYAGTRQAIFKGWESMVAEASPGDTLIFFFSGHGGQENEHGEPWDESEDETFMTAEFERENPLVGRITDDELRGMFSDADQFNILFIADSCHSGHIYRSGGKPRYKSRNGGTYQVDPRTMTPAPPAPSLAIPDHEPLPHVTYLLATEENAGDVKETSFDGTPHGALSWYFVEALHHGDRNGDGGLSRAELADYLIDRVRVKMNELQLPSVLPTSNPGHVALRVSGSGNRPGPRSFVDAPVYISVGDADESFVKVLTGVELREHAFELAFDVQFDETVLFNSSGDKIASLDTHDVEAWQRAIDGYRLRRYLNRQSALPASFTVTLSARRGHHPDDLHRDGDSLYFRFGRQSDRRLAPTVFSLTGSGKLQFHYPLPRDEAVVGQFPMGFRMIVERPYGADHLLAIACSNQPHSLQKLLFANDQGGPPSPAAIAAALKGHECRVGQKGLFTAP